MARIKFLLIGVLVAALAAVCTPMTAMAALPTCLPADAILGTCPTVGGVIVDGGVELGADVNVPGSGGGNEGAGSNTGGAPGASTPAPGGTPPVGREIVRDGYTVTGPVTLSDLANFRPAPGRNNMEPDGWMIVGLDTNFYATAPVQLQDGLLLDEQATVRFTPVRYHWSYGDGSSASRSTPGATWRAQGLSEFDRTPTSHVYRSPGTYYIDLTIDYAAEYRWAGGTWTSIAGTIPVPANRLVATAGGAKTVLVEHECTLNPRGPGC